METDYGCWGGGYSENYCPTGNPLTTKRTRVEEFFTF